MTYIGLLRYITVCYNPVEYINNPNGLTAVAVLHIPQFEPPVCPTVIRCPVCPFLRPKLEGIGEEPDLEWHLLRCKELNPT